MLRAARTATRGLRRQTAGRGHYFAGTKPLPSASHPRLQPSGSKAARPVRKRREAVEKTTSVEKEATEKLPDEDARSDTCVQAQDLQHPLIRGQSPEAKLSPVCPQGEVCKAISALRSYQIRMSMTVWPAQSINQSRRTLKQENWKSQKKLQLNSRYKLRTTYLCLNIKIN